MRILRHPSNYGKGHAVKTGVGAARGVYVGFMDADLSTALECLDPAMDGLRHGAAVVIGSRRAPGARIHAPQSWTRRLGSALFRRAAGAAVGLDGVSDSQCGFKFFAGAVARELFALQTLRGYLFDVEILAIARRRGHAVREIPVAWQERTHGRSITLRLIYETLRDLGRVRRRVAALPDATRSAVAR